MKSKLILFIACWLGLGITNCLYLNKAWGQNQSTSNQQQKIVEQLLGTYEDNEWTVNVYQSADDPTRSLNYSGTNKKTGDNIKLSLGFCSESKHLRVQKVCLWENNNYEYRLTWLDERPNSVLLQVYDPKKQQILSRQLSKKP